MGEKSGDNFLYDDLIVFGDMFLFDVNEVIKIWMGKGNDVLNIDGRLGLFSMVNVFDVELGFFGYNSLNFGGMVNDYGIIGIVFDVRIGNLEFKYGLIGFQIVGIVKYVEILGVLLFNDKIMLYVSRVGSKGFDFIVFKFNGLVMYKIDIVYFVGQLIVRYFKIIDVIVGGNGCVGYVFVLKLVNFVNGVKVNDILYQDDRIFVYGQ